MNVKCGDRCAGLYYTNALIRLLYVNVLCALSNAFVRQFLGVPVFAIVDRSGNPYIFSEERVLIPKYNVGVTDTTYCNLKNRKTAKKQRWSLLRWRNRASPDRVVTVQRGLLFLNANDATAYMNQLVKTSCKPTCSFLFLSAFAFLPLLICSC